MDQPILQTNMVDPQVQQARMRQMMRQQERAARRMVNKIENMIEGNENGTGVDLTSNQNNNEAAED